MWQRTYFPGTQQEDVERNETTKPEMCISNWLSTWGSPNVIDEKCCVWPDQF